jgi:hypothetical protein
MNYKLFLIVLIFVYGYGFAQTNADRAIAANFFQSATKTTIDSVTIQSALFFLETPYIAGTLDRAGKEELVVNLREMDCVTLVENCLAFSRTIQSSSPDWDSFVRELQQIRYRNGIIDGYASRLHYTTDWIFDNIGKGIFEDVTNALGGSKFTANVYYMSENYQLYKHLAGDPEAVRQIKQTEQTINARSNYYYIPKREIAQHQSRIKNGDIICFTTSIPGLDISHIGIAYWNGRQLTFIHASTSAKKVIVNPEPLIDYCNQIRTNTGIMVLRPIDSEE